MAIASNARNGLKPLSCGVITEQPPEQPQTVPSMASCAMPCVAQQDAETTTNGGEPKRYWQAVFFEEVFCWFNFWSLGPGGNSSMLLEVFIPQMRKWSNVTRFLIFRVEQLVEPGALVSVERVVLKTYSSATMFWVGGWDFLIFSIFSNYYTELPSEMSKILFWGGIYWVITIQLPFYRSEQRPKTLIICCIFAGIIWKIYRRFIG